MADENDKTVKKTKPKSQPVNHKVEESLLKLLRKGAQPLKDLSFSFNMSKEAVVKVAEKLTEEGYEIRAYDTAEGERILQLVQEEEVSLDAMQVPLTKRKFRIAFIAEPRFGAFQAQVSMMHWLYKDAFIRDEIDCVIVAGGMTVGAVTPVIQPDVFKSDLKKPSILTDYVVKQFPKSNKFKTYVIANRRELEFRRKYGANILNHITRQRDDMALVGDIERTFDFRGVRIKVMAPWDDNAPKGLSYGLQKIVDGLADRPAPHVIVVGGMHKRCELADYGEDGVHVFSVPSLHTQMRRQKRKGVHPRLGYLMLELEFNKDWSFDKSTGLKAHHVNLDDYAVARDCFATVEDLNTRRLSKPYQKILGWFMEEENISIGELSRRMNKSKAFVRKVIAGLERKAKVSIPYVSASKRYELQPAEKKTFKPLPLKYDEVFQFKTKSAGMACTHYGSNQDMPDAVRLAYNDAAASGVRRMFHAGDFTDGPPSGGYRGHQNDVKVADMDSMEDYTVARFPKVLIKGDPKRPILRTELVINENGQPTYKEVLVKDGETPLQTDAIDGNHDCWAVTMMGHRPVRALALRLPDLIRYAGPADGKINMDGAVTVDGVYNRMTHGSGGLGYTVSVKVQKHLSGHRRRGPSRGIPTVLWLGNWHNNFLYLEDELCVLLACFKSEDEFHLKLGLVSLVGMNVVELYADNKNNLTRVVSNYRNYRALAVTNK